MARPVEWTEESRSELLRLFLSYITETEVPIIAEFAYQNGIYRQRMYEWPEFTDAIKLCITKKEAQLEKGALSGQLNTTMAIFSLKQIGWRDRQEIALEDNRDAEWLALIKNVETRSESETEEDT